MTWKLLFAGLLFAGVTQFVAKEKPAARTPTRVCEFGHYEKQWIGGAYADVLGSVNGELAEVRRWEPGHWQAVWICDQWEPE